jgi:hypothetical protein
MAAQTAASGYPIRENVGSLTLYVVKFTSVSTTDTYASGLGTNVVGYWANAENDEGTDGDEGVNVANSSGTFTFALKTAGVVYLYILART